MDLDLIWLVSLTEPTQGDHRVNVTADGGDVCQARKHQTLPANKEKPGERP